MANFLSRPPFAAPTLLVVGDSLSAGYRLDQGSSWVDILASNTKRLLGTDLQVLNASISGETTTGGLSRLPGLLDRHQPTSVLIVLGANDGLRGLPLETMQENLKAMFALVEATGLKFYMPVLNYHEITVAHSRVHFEMLRTRSPKRPAHPICHSF